ncbi:uncharacterized protein V6R79_004073 [Siganus canaliculatus]
MEGPDRPLASTRPGVRDFHSGLCRCSSESGSCSTSTAPPPISRHTAEPPPRKHGPLPLGPTSWTRVLDPHTDGSPSPADTTSQSRRWWPSGGRSRLAGSASR